jgi:hypothetical protein
MNDDHSFPTEEEGIDPGDRSVRFIRKLKTAHRIQSDHPNPVGQQGIFSPVRCQTPPIGMSDHPGAQAPEDDCTEMMVWMMVGEDQPLNWLPRDRANGGNQSFTCTGAFEGIDDNHTVFGDHKPGIRPTL